MASYDFDAPLSVDFNNYDDDSEDLDYFEITSPRPYNIRRSSSVNNLDNPSRNNKPVPKPSPLINSLDIHTQDKPLRGQSNQTRLTIAKTPKLLTKSRVRACNVLSQEEREQKEYQEMLNYQFKASKVNANVLAGPSASSKPIVKKQNTVPQPFQITNKKREPTMQQIVEERKTNFKAHPIPKKILEHVTGIKPKVVQGLTVPDTPTVLKRSALREKQLHFDEKGVLQESVQGHHGIVWKLDKTNVKPVSKPPLKLLEHCEMMKKRKEERIQAMLKETTEKNKLFHARPAPKFVTQNPSSLTDETNNQENCSSWVHFKAKPAKVLNRAPFVPVKEHRQPTEFQEFKLSHQERHERRVNLQKQKAEQLAKLEEYLKNVKLKEEQKMKEEMILQRKETVHKPLPILKSVFQLKPPTPTITIPKTPNVVKRTNDSNKN